MTTFIFSQALNSINNKRNQITSIYNSIKDSFVDTTIWKKDKITGKLSELSIQSSSYNRVIPIVYGINRISGNIIWLDNVKEVRNSNINTIKIGKGQKVKQDTIEYFYYLSFAIAICKGEIEEIKNVWADSNLINLSKYKYRFYNGSETQNQDVLIKSINGKTPAYRGLAYIVFENFPLSEFNNRIPNFLFEVERKNNFDKEFMELDYAVNGVNLMPAIGYSAINTSLQYKAEEEIKPQYINTGLGVWTILNQNNDKRESDILLSLNDLDKKFKNCQWVVPHIAIFGNNIDIKYCELKPRVDFNFFENRKNSYDYNIYTKPNSFNVGIKWNRYNTPLLNKNSGINESSFSDSDVLSLFRELKNRGKKTIFCPEILFDIDGKPSSKLLGGNYEDVHNFFHKENGYNEFIIHYANLLNGLVDVFLIGNELTSITKIHNEEYNFIGVDNLIELANVVRSILGKNVKISYTAGFKEYHNFDGWYNLDKLWSNENIDFVGINAFFRLTSITQENITKEIVKEYWFKGEGYETINNEQVEAKYAYKNIKFWWENKHINKNNIVTEWIEKSKKIWFIEYGFPSINLNTSEYYIEDFSKYSKSSFAAQKAAIEGTESAFLNCEYIENKFVYYWDIRPYPFYPGNLSKWPDGRNWLYNYCLNGKNVSFTSKVLIKQLFQDSGIDLNFINNINLDESISGFVINNTLTLRDVLYLIQKVYFFDCIEQNYKISFISNKNKNVVNRIKYSDLLLIENNKYIDINIVNSSELPNKINLLFLDKNKDYDINSVSFEKNSIKNNRIYVENIPFVLEEKDARNIAEIMMYLIWLERTTFNFVLPIKFLNLENSDIIELEINNKIYILKIINIKIENYKINITATLFDNKIYKCEENNVINENINISTYDGKSNITIFETPALNNNMIDKVNLFIAVNGELKSWSGANIFFSNKNKDYKFIYNTKNTSGIANVLKTNQNRFIKPYYFDNYTKIVVKFNKNFDTSDLNTLEDLYNNDNIAIYGNEILKFLNIELNEDGTYNISKLLRGLFGTEDEINNHNENDYFILINDLLFKQEFDYDKIDYQYYYKINSIDSNEEKKIIYKILGKNLKPLKPCFVKVNKYADHLHIEWKEKIRGYTNWLNNRENMSIEKYQRYYLEFYNNNKIIDKLYVNDKFCDYFFNINIDKIKLCQINDFYGFGDFVEIVNFL